MAIDPHAVPLLVDGLSDHDLAIGSRALRASMVETTYAVRSLMGRLFNELVTTGTGLGFRDTQCGFKAFRTPVARLLFHLVRIDRFAFDVELLIEARRLGLTVTEVPVHWRHVTGSTIHPLHDSLSMLADVCRSRLGLVPAPPLTALTVRPPGGDPVDRDLLRRIGAVLWGTLDGAPVPLLPRGGEVTALLALVEPAEAALAFSALRAELDPATVTRRSLGRDDLVALGPLAGRLVAAAPDAGT